MNETDSEIDIELELGNYSVEKSGRGLKTVDLIFHSHGNYCLFCVALTISDIEKLEKLLAEAKKQFKVPILQKNFSSP